MEDMKTKLTEMHTRCPTLAVGSCWLSVILQISNFEVILYLGHFFIHPVYTAIATSLSKQVASLSSHMLPSHMMPSPEPYNAKLQAVRAKLRAFRAFEPSSEPFEPNSERFEPSFKPFEPSSEPFEPYDG